MATLRFLSKESSGLTSGREFMVSRRLWSPSLALMESMSLVATCDSGIGAAGEGEGERRGGGGGGGRKRERGKKGDEGRVRRGEGRVNDG